MPNGDDLRVLRLTSGLKVSDLARVADVSPSTWWRWEHHPALGDAQYRKGRRAFRRARKEAINRLKLK